LYGMPVFLGEAVRQTSLDASAWSEITNDSIPDVDLLKMCRQVLMQRRFLSATWP
jgi:hypothetical protein